jgi:hypothetical protein
MHYIKGHYAHFGKYIKWPREEFNAQSFANHAFRRSECPVPSLPAAMQGLARKERILQNEKECKRRTPFLDLWAGILHPGIAHRD